MKNHKIAPNRSAIGALNKIGVTRPKTPIGAKRMMKSVSFSITSCVLSQNFCCASRWSRLSLPMNTPNSSEKVMTPSSWLLLVAASTMFDGNIRRKISKRSLLLRPSTLLIRPSLKAVSLPRPSMAVAVSASMRPGPIRFTTIKPTITATAPLKV